MAQLVGVEWGTPYVARIILITMTVDGWCGLPVFLFRVTALIKPAAADRAADRPGAGSGVTTATQRAAGSLVLLALSV
jgi:hypothetical protein